MSVKPAGIVSLIVAVLAVVNYAFSAMGLPAIPVDENAIAAVINGIVGLVGVAGTVWYNFNMTNASKIGQAFTDGMKSGDIDLNEGRALITEAMEAAKPNHLKGE